VADAPAYSLQELARTLQLETDATADTRITGIAPLDKAGPHQISFYSNRRYYQDLLRTRAAAVILRPADAAACPVATLCTPNPYAAYAQLSNLFEPRRTAAPGCHPSALVDPSAELDPDVSVGPHAVIGAGCSIGAGVRIDANVVIGEDCRIGAGSHLYPNVTLYDRVCIGERCTVHASAVLGSDGFGYAQERGRHLKIAQLGGVRIGDDVEIGAGTSIDRGALEDTVIGNGVKIDNQVQIAHNVQIGNNTVICGCSAIAGSSVIGNDCIIAGAVGVINHVSICDGVTVTAMSLVNQSITEPGVYSSGTGLSDSTSWRRNIVRFRQLDELFRRILQLEKK